MHGSAQMEKRVAGNAYGWERELCACLSSSETSLALVGRSGRCGRGEGDRSLLSGRENDDGSIATSNGFSS